jgi:diaminohydroxyphosphoribosylaminopyrimidine deaminase/5-amino-6-(5-phosphoribosylamino)uracil reductase
VQTSPDADRRYMTVALTLARRGLGQVAPNPAVGCVLVRDGRVVGRGWTGRGGRPHAETRALAAAGEHARGAAAYVTLEPCSHQGVTPPCCDALIAAGVRRVVAAVQDPDPRVSGQGLERLRGAGVEVEVGICRAEAEDLNIGFFTRTLLGRPMVTWKVASTLDGRIATTTGDSRWITGAQARARAHLLRASHDAVMVGTNTGLADDPRLDVRLPGLEDSSPVRIVLDRQRRLPRRSRLLAATPKRPTWLVVESGRDVDIPRRPGLTVLAVPAESDDGRLSLPHLLTLLGEREITRLMVEGGGVLAGGLLAADLVDRIVWFRGALVVGGDGRPAADGFGVETLEHARRFTRTDHFTVGEDLVELFSRRT